jgi:hypothetical protein
MRIPKVSAEAGMKGQMLIATDENQMHTDNSEWIS